jgi:hypothetical protein
MPGNDSLAIDVWTGFMGAGEMKVEMDGCSDRQFGGGIEEYAAAADIEAARGKILNRALYGGADDAGTASFTNASEKTPSDFEETMTVEGLEQNAITAGKEAVILFTGFAGHDNRDLAQGWVGLDLQAALRPRHAGDFLGKIDELRFFRAAVGQGLGGILCFEEGHGDVAEKLFLDRQKKT